MQEKCRKLLANVSVDSGDRNGNSSTRRVSISGNRRQLDETKDALQEIIGEPEDLHDKETDASKLLEQTSNEAAFSVVLLLSIVFLLGQMNGDQPENAATRTTAKAKKVRKE